jgi:hypothetical protein
MSGWFPRIRIFFEILEKEGNRMSEPMEKKVYVEPTLERQEKLENITEGGAPVVTGAVVVG